VLVKSFIPLERNIAHNCNIISHCWEYQFH